MIPDIAQEEIALGVELDADGVVEVGIDRGPTIPPVSRTPGAGDG